MKKRSGSDKSGSVPPTGHMQKPQSKGKARRRLEGDARAPSSQDAERSRQEAAALGAWLGVDMEFHVRSSCMLHELGELARASCSTPSGDGVFEFPLDGGNIHCRAYYRGIGDKAGGEPGFVIHWGGFVLDLPDRGTTTTRRRLRVHADSTVCAGLKLRDIVAAVCKLVESLAAELEVGEVLFTEPFVQLPALEADELHIESIGYDNGQRKGSAPAHLYGESFRQWLEEQD